MKHPSNIVAWLRGDWCVCTSCKENKHISLYSKREKEYIRRQCKVCIAKQNSLYQRIHKEQTLNKAKKYRKNNYEKCLQSSREWRKNNLKYDAFRAATYRARRNKQTPKWANLNKIEEIYLNCPKGLHVDHIIPLKGIKASGLHVENNLQYLTPEENLSKRNLRGW